tara:strand:- start:62 stop:628 length:567 start_codon:yes stop_codon:yes gene_type:complete
MAIDLENDSVNLKISVNPEQLKDIGQLVEKLLDTQKNLQRIEEESKELKKVERELSEISIPEAMQAAHCDEYKCSEEHGGARIKITDFITARVKKDDDEALDWLRENGAGQLIKNTVSVDFDLNEDSEAQGLIEDLQQRNMNCKQKQGVHSGTLSAWVREEFMNGRSVNLDLLNVYQCKKTKLTIQEK